MGLLEDIAVYLDAETTLTAQTTLFVSKMPNEPDALVVLYEYGGREPAQFFGENTPPGYEQPSMQVISRADTYTVAMARAREVFTKLSLIANETINGNPYIRIQPLQSPFPFQRDQTERVHIGCNYQVWKP